MKYENNPNAFFIIHTDCLNDQQSEEIKSLTACGCKPDSHSFSYPCSEEGCHHYLLYRSAADHSGSPSLVSVLAVIPFSEEAECIAFTRPDCRVQGYFSALFKQALKDFEDFDILFPVTETCPDTLAALNALGAEPDMTELQMELDLSTVLPSHPSLFSNTCLLSEADPTASFCQWTLCSGDTNATAPLLHLGSCQTSPVSSCCLCLHHVEILPKFRGQGYGTALLVHLISALKQQGILRLILQVSGDNQAALALYKKQGFRTTETLTYYLY